MQSEEMTKNIFSFVKVKRHWHRLSWHVEGSPILEIFKNHLDLVKANLFWVTLFEQWVWTRRLPEIPSNHSHSVILSQLWGQAANDTNKTQLQKCWKGVCMSSNCIPFKTLTDAKNTYCMPNQHSSKWKLCPFYCFYLITCK